MIETGEGWYNELRATQFENVSLKQGTGKLHPNLLR